MVQSKKALLLVLHVVALPCATVRLLVDPAHQLVVPPDGMEHDIGSYVQQKTELYRNDLASKTIQFVDPGVQNAGKLAQKTEVREHHELARSKPVELPLREKEKAAKPVWRGLNNEEKATKPVKLGLNNEDSVTTPVKFGQNSMKGVDDDKTDPYTLYTFSYDGTHNRIEMGWGHVIWQILFGIAYYMAVITKYPKISEIHPPTERSIKLQTMNEVSATCESSWTNILLSCCCEGPRGAHTLDKAGILNYWIGLLLMSVCPCLVLCLTRSLTDLNEKLGGTKRNIVMSCLCACFCCCCVITQDAESLDEITGAKTSDFIFSSSS